MADQWDVVAAAMRQAVTDTVAALVHPDPPPAPAAVDLSRWKLTLPMLGEDGKIREITPAALGKDWARYFAAVDGGYLFRVWHGGATTKMSLNPRSELRELDAGGKLADWSTTSGRHTLNVVTQVNRLTKVKPHVVLAQIHDDEDDVTVWRLEGSKLYVTKGDDPHAYLARDNVQLGETLTLGLEVADGVVRYRLGGGLLDYALGAKTSGCYFKAGNYLQSNPKTAPGESTDEYSEVLLHSGVVTHT